MLWSFSLPHFPTSTTYYYIPRRSVPNQPDLPRLEQARPNDFRLATFFHLWGHSCSSCLLLNLKSTLVSPSTDIFRHFLCSPNRAAPPAPDLNQRWLILLWFFTKTLIHCWWACVHRLPYRRRWFSHLCTHRTWIWLQLVCCGCYHLFPPDSVFHCRSSLDASQPWGTYLIPKLRFKLFSAFSPNSCGLLCQ
jgi:hypothetical protein